MDKALKTGGWLWTGFAALVGLACIAQGMGLAAVLFFLSAGAATPPLWGFLREKGVWVPLAARVGVGAVFLIAASFMVPPQPSAQRVAQGERSEPEASGRVGPPQNEGGLASLERKIGADAVMQMDRESFSNTYNRLGRAQFDNANDLARWAAIAAAESDQCPLVEIVGISDSATRQALRWYVDCSNRERFMITEAQAIAARDRNDPSASPEARRRAQQMALAEPQLARRNSGRPSQFND